MPESLLRLKQQTVSIRHKRKCGKGCSEQANQAAGDSCWAALWRRRDSVCRHFCSNGGCVFLLIGKTRSSPIMSALGEAWETSLLDQPTSASNVTTSLSNSVCFGLGGQRGRQVKDEINNAEKCFRKEKTDENKMPLIFLPLHVWVWLITRYEEFADFSLLIVL